MASTFTGLGTELMTTGENAGTWGTKTNTNLSIVEQISGGYIEQDIGGSADTTTLSVSDGSAGAVLAHRIIKFTGTITGNQIVTIPLDVQQLYVLVNGTSGAFTVQFKYVSGSGSSVTFAATDKGSKLVYATADDATNPNLVDSGIASTGDQDLDGNELVLDADGETSITADTDDQIDIKIAGADDFQFTANTFTAQSGSTIAAQALTATTVTASGILKTDDTTEATSTTDGSLQTDGGLSVAKDAVFGDDVKLLSDSAVLSFGADSDTTLTHTDGTGLTLNSTNKLLFRDTGLYINSSTDGQLDIVADTEIQIAATTIDINGAIAMDGAITGATDITLSGELDAATLDISGNADIDGTLETDALSINGTAVTSTATELNLLDGVSGLVQADLTKLAAVDSTAAELNIVDGGTSATSTTVADADRVVLNDNGTMVQVAVTDLAAYFDDEISAMPNLVTTAATTVGALNSGSITSGFGTIDTGSSTITTTGLISGGSLDIDNVLINGTTIGHTDDTDLLTVADGLLTVAGEISVTTLDIGGTNVTTTAAEINLIDGGASTGTTAVADADGILTNDDGTMRLTTAATFKTYFQSGVTASSIAADDISAGDAAVTIGNGSTSADVTIDSGDDVVIDAAGGNIEFKDAGTTQLTLDMDGTANAQVIQLRVDTDDLIFKQFDGTTVLTLDDDTTVKVATDLTVGDDLTLLSDSAVLGFGADTDTTLTHTDGTGLTLNSTNKLCFNDASQFVQGSSGTVLSLGATDEIDLTATAIDINGTCDISGTFSLAGTNVTSTATELNKLDGVGTLKEAGKETIWVPSNAMTPTTSNGAERATVETTSGRPDMQVLDFDKDSDEFAQFAVAFPKSWNLGTVTFQCFWSGLAATTGVAISLEGVAMNDNETIDVAYGTAVVVTDDAQGAVEELLVTAESGAVTIAGTAADNDLCYFRVGRDVSDGNDDMAGDMRLHGIKIFFTTDAANDA